MIDVVVSCLLLSAPPAFDDLSSSAVVWTPAVWSAITANCKAGQSDEFEVNRCRAGMRKVADAVNSKVFYSRVKSVRLGRYDFTAQRFPAELDGFALKDELGLKSSSLSVAGWTPVYVPLKPGPAEAFRKRVASGVRAELLFELKLLPKSSAWSLVVVGVRVITRDGRVIASRPVSRTTRLTPGDAPGGKVTLPVSAICARLQADRFRSAATRCGDRGTTKSLSVELTVGDSGYPARLAVSPDGPIAACILSEPASHRLDRFKGCHATLSFDFP